MSTNFKRKYRNWKEHDLRKKYSEIIGEIVNTKDIKKLQKLHEEAKEVLWMIRVHESFM